MKVLPSSLLLVLWACNCADGLRNVTVDDSENSVVLSPVGSWTSTSDDSGSLDYGGSIAISTNASATACFTFTGVAVYFMSPLWSYAVEVSIALDNGESELVDLQDHTSSATDMKVVQSAPVKGFVGLAPTQHTLVVSMAPGRQSVLVDGFIYTLDDAYMASDAASGTVSTNGALATNPTSTSNGSSPTFTPKAKRSTQITIGVSIGSVLLLAVIAAILFCRRPRHRSSMDGEAWAHPRMLTQSRSPSYPPSRSRALDIRNDRRSSRSRKDMGSDKADSAGLPSPPSVVNFTPVAYFDKRRISPEQLSDPFSSYFEARPRGSTSGSNILHTPFQRNDDPNYPDVSAFVQQVQTPMGASPLPNLHVPSSSKKGASPLPALAPLTDEATSAAAALELRPLSRVTEDRESRPSSGGSGRHQPDDVPVVKTPTPPPSIAHSSSNIKGLV